MPPTIVYYSDSGSAPPTTRDWDTYADGIFDITDGDGFSASDVTANVTTASTTYPTMAKFYQVSGTVVVNGTTMNYIASAADASNNTISITTGAEETALAIWRPSESKWYYSNGDENNAWYEDPSDADQDRVRTGDIVVFQTEAITDVSTWSDFQISSPIVGLTYTFQASGTTKSGSFGTGASAFPSDITLNTYGVSNPTLHGIRSNVPTGDGTVVDWNSQQSGPHAAMQAANTYSMWRWIDGPLAGGEARTQRTYKEIVDSGGTGLSADRTWFDSEAATWTDWSAIGPTSANTSSSAPIDQVLMSKQYEFAIWTQSTLAYLKGTRLANSPNLVVSSAVNGGRIGGFRQYSSGGTRPYSFVAGETLTNQFTSGQVRFGPVDSWSYGGYTYPAIQTTSGALSSQTYEDFFLHSSNHLTLKITIDGVSHYFRNDMNPSVFNCQTGYIAIQNSYFSNWNYGIDQEIEYELVDLRMPT